MREVSDFRWREYVLIGLILAVAITHLSIRVEALERKIGKRVE